MQKLPFAALLMFGAASSLAAQAAVGPCASPDSILVSGNKRVAASTILTDAALTTGVPLNVPAIQRAIRNVFQTGQFDGVNVDCVLAEGTPPKATLVITVSERPVLDPFNVGGRVSMALLDELIATAAIVGRSG